MTTSGSERRKFIRHPIHIPIKLHVERESEPVFSHSTDLSQGGLSFYWSEPLEQGSTLSLDIPVKGKNFKINATVAYSIKDKKMGSFKTGVSFLESKDAFKAKLAEEMIEIMEYRKKVSSRKGQTMTEEEAAEAWIKRFAKRFARLFRR